MSYSEDYFLALLEGKADLFEALLAAKKLKEKHFGSFIETCAILNAKSGRCASDCKFCAQSARYQTKAPVYPLLEERELMAKAKEAYERGINRFSFVTSGIKLSAKEFSRLLKVIAALKGRLPGLQLCASLGQLEKEELLALKEAGLSRYHHNLETAESFYPRL